MAPAIAGSQTSDGNQSLDRSCVHRINEYAGGSGKQARSTEDQLRSWRDAERLNDHVSAEQRAFHRVLIKGIAV